MPTIEQRLRFVEYQNQISISDHATLHQQAEAFQAQVNTANTNQARFEAKLDDLLSYFHAQERH